MASSNLRVVIVQAMKQRASRGVATYSRQMAAATKSAVVDGQGTWVESYLGFRGLGFRV